ncbi:hypothetical protein [Sphingobacterium sp. SYP-B4668]|uniref:hypothetical protein n=1 Tax=Sphingobacterium sp. SYP-B4668 TaxID=2996035 RepID=UPI0022DD5871|nr:hypothetical protein [Sphingobacterium sp. SYP-B4668]
MKKLKVSILAAALLLGIGGAVAEINTSVVSEIVTANTPSGPQQLDLADKDNDASPSRWECQNVQPEPCYRHADNTPSAETGLAVAY